MNNDNGKAGLVDRFYEYARKMRALLGADPDVTVLDDAKSRAINIAVAGCGKPDAYRVFFPGEIEIGDGGSAVTILVNGHKKTYVTNADEAVLREMLCRHPLVDRIVRTTFPDGSPNRLFVLWKNAAIQYVDDNFGSPYGATTTTPEQLSKEILGKCNDMVVWWSTASGFPLAQNDEEIFG